MNSYIIEGCDATGKTELSNYIRKKKGSAVIHLDDRINEFQNFYQLSGVDNVVYDRFILSEYVYSKVFGRTRKVSLEDIRIILNKWREHGNKVIILRADKNVIKMRLAERGQYLDEKIIEMIDDVYATLAEVFDIQLIDTTNGYDMEDIL